MAAKKKDEPPVPWGIKPFTECFAFLPGRRMLTGHALDNEIREWALEDGLVVRVRRNGRKNRDGINAIAVRPGGQQFLAAGQDAGLRLWALDREKPVVEIAGQTSAIDCLEWLDERRAVSGGRDGKLRVWDLDAQRPMLEADHGDHVVGLATDGHVAWTGGWDRVCTVKRWDLASGKSLGNVATLGKPCASMARSPDGKRVACVTFGGALHLFAWSSGDEIARREDAHDDRIDGVVWASNERIVTVSEFDKTLRLFDANAKPLAAIRDLPRPARIAFGPDEVLYVAIAYARIDRFHVRGDALIGSEGA